jgi:hypothetical protein
MIVGLLSRVDFFLSLFLSLSRSLALSLFPRYVSPIVFFLLPIVIGMTFFSFFFFLSISSYTNQNFWPIKSLFLSFVAQERKTVCVCVYVYVCCCCFWQVAAVLPEKKMCVRKGESLSSTFVVCYMIYW